MSAHTEKEFNTFMNQLIETNATLSFFTDFEKIKTSVDRIEIKLNTLNYLLGKEDLESAVKELWDNDSRVFDVLLILIACRKRDNKKIINDETQTIPLNNFLNTADGVVDFLEGTGLATVFRDKSITNLVDYVFGVEVGLDTNARKNRSGHAMEKIVEDAIHNSGLTYQKEVYSTEWPEIVQALGTDKKRFDFVIKTESKTYLLEVNFYSGGGSKLNETARSYCEIYNRISKVPGYEFVWITDGKGWNSARNKLKEAYDIIPNLFNLTTFKGFIKQLSSNV